MTRRQNTSFNKRINKFILKQNIEFLRNKILTNLIVDLTHSKQTISHSLCKYYSFQKKNYQC